MDKIKIKLEGVTNTKVKYNKQTINVKTYISRDEMLMLTKLSLDNCFANLTELDDSFIAITDAKVAYDLIVLEVCTDIDLDGVATDSIICGGIIEAITPHIRNYAETWNLIKQAIQNKIMYDGLKLVSKAVPTSKQMNNSLKKFSDAMGQLKENPEILKEITRLTAQEAARATGRIKFEEEKNKKKG